MRFSLAIAACFGLALVATTGQASAQGQSESESSARLLVLNGGPAAQFDGGPRILRGSPGTRSPGIQAGAGHLGLRTLRTTVVPLRKSARRKVVPGIAVPNAND